MSNPKTISSVIPKATKALRAVADRRIQATDSATVNAAKHLFLRVARSVCPGFTVRPEHRKLLNDIVLWCIGARGDLHITKGLWLYGEIGAGKSTLLQIISRFWPLVSGSQYVFRLSNIVEVCGQYENDGIDALSTFIDWRIQAFDEVGRESIPAYHFGSHQNVMEYILHRRYDRRSATLTFVTTNLRIDQISEYYGEHIFDRARQMFNFIPVMGPSYRTEVE